jgi:hypothetical protein
MIAEPGVWVRRRPDNAEPGSAVHWARWFGNIEARTPVMIRVTVGDDAYRLLGSLRLSRKKPAAGLQRRSRAMMIAAPDKI